MPCPSPSPPAACSEHGWHLPFQLPERVPREGSPWPGWAGRAELRAGTPRRIALWQLLLSNTNTATTRTSQADNIAARRGGSGGAPGVPTRPRPAGRCRCPALPWESTMRSTSPAGQSGEEAVFQALPSQRGWWDPEGSSAPRGGRGAVAPHSSAPSSPMQKRHTSAR